MTIPDTVVQTLAPKNRNTFIPETAVPDIDTGNHSFICVKDKVMKPPKNPNNVLMTNQNQYSFTSPERRKITAHTAVKHDVPMIIVRLLEWINPLVVSVPINNVLNILPIPSDVIIHDADNANPYTVSKYFTAHVP